MVGEASGPSGSPRGLSGDENRRKGTRVSTARQVGQEGPDHKDRQEKQEKEGYVDPILTEYYKEKAIDDKYFEGYDPDKDHDEIEYVPEPPME